MVVAATDALLVQLLNDPCLAESDPDGVTLMAYSDGASVTDLRAIGYRSDMQPFELHCDNPLLRPHLDNLQTASTTEGGPAWLVAQLKLLSGGSPAENLTLKLVMEGGDVTPFEISPERFDEVARRVNPGVTLPEPGPRREVAPGRFELPGSVEATGAVTCGAPLRQQVAEELAACDQDRAPIEHVGLAELWFVRSESSGSVTLALLADGTIASAGDVGERAFATSVLHRLMGNLSDAMDPTAQSGALVATRRSSDGHVEVKDYWGEEADHWFNLGGDFEALAGKISTQLSAASSTAGS